MNENTLQSLRDAIGPENVLTGQADVETAVEAMKRALGIGPTVPPAPPMLKSSRGES